MAISLKDLAANADVREKIFSICDIDIVVDPSEAAWITIDGATDFSVIARDGTGGLFIVTRSSPRVIYASSEGEAGVIADDLVSLMTLIVSCPYWLEVLKYSRDGNLDEVRRAAPYLSSHGSETRRSLLPHANFSHPSLEFVAARSPRSHWRTSPCSVDAD